MCAAPSSTTCASGSARLPGSKRSATEDVRHPGGVPTWWYRQLLVRSNVAAVTLPPPPDSPQEPSGRAPTRLPTGDVDGEALSAEGPPIAPFPPAAPLAAR